MSRRTPRRRGIRRPTAETATDDRPTREWGRIRVERLHWKLWYWLARLLRCAGRGKLSRAAGLRGHRLVEAASARAAAEARAEAEAEATRAPR